MCCALTRQQAQHKQQQTEQPTTKATSYGPQSIRKMPVFTCPYCQKQCKTSGGLFQHISRTPTCKEAEARKLLSQQLADTTRRGDADAEALADSVAQPTRRSQRLQIQEEITEKREQVAPGNQSKSVDDPGEDEAFSPPDDNDLEEEDAESPAEDSHLEATNASSNQISDGTPTPDTLMLEQFRAYCDSHKDLFLPLNAKDRTSIK